jgi:hypothetical protein
MTSIFSIYVELLAEWLKQADAVMTGEAHG